MTKVKTLEFWLFALPVLFGLAVWAGAAEQDLVAKYLVPICLGAWAILAVLWMLREIVRKIRD